MHIAVPSLQDKMLEPVTNMMNSLDQQSMHQANASALHLLCIVLQDAAQQPLANIVNTLEQKRTQRHSSKARVDSMATMVDHNKTHAQEHRECHTCGRQLAEGREMDEFLNRQVTRALHVPWSRGSGIFQWHCPTAAAEGRAQPASRECCQCMACCRTRRYQ